ncbi:helix-turn-helix domain-containing protein [Thalassobellus citreus]|uniref:helix-turn-helix domain-containing protein n=1 Tax=Thalassobellus citreus TaxID=3367752 RepID=UPI00379FC2CB
MALDVFKYFSGPVNYNRLVGDDFLFVEYKCPIDIENFKVWTEVPFLSYVISGKKDWTAIEGTHQLKQGEAIFLKKGVYNTKQYFEEDYCTLLFFITEDFIRRFIKKYKETINIKLSYLNENQIYPINVEESLKSLFMSIFNYMNRTNEIPRELVLIKFEELLCNIILNPKNKKLTDFFLSLEQVEKTDLNNVMMKNFYSDLTMEEFARLSGRSLSTFKRDFKAYYNQTPGKWLNNKRLEYAKTLLENPDLNINDICWESGFKNASHFNSSFKDKYNLPPNQYRKKLRASSL